jgi:hypothetical protein
LSAVGTKHFDLIIYQLHSILPFASSGYSFGGHMPTY